MIKHALFEISFQVRSKNPIKGTRIKKKTTNIDVSDIFTEDNDDVYATDRMNDFIVRLFPSGAVYSEFITFLLVPV